MQDKCAVKFMSGYLQSSVQHAEASIGRVRLQGGANSTICRHQCICPVPRPHKMVPPNGLQGRLQLQSRQAPAKSFGHEGDGWARSWG